MDIIEWNSQWFRPPRPYMPRYVFGNWDAYIAGESLPRLLLTSSCHGSWLKIYFYVQSQFVNCNWSNCIHSWKGRIVFYMVTSLSNFWIMTNSWVRLQPISSVQRISLRKTVPRIQHSHNGFCAGQEIAINSSTSRSLNSSAWLIFIYSTVGVWHTIGSCR